MKSLILASLLFLPQTHAACTYDVAPIRTLFNSLDTSPSFEGPRTERERLSDASTEVRRTNGGWFVREVAVDHWRFLGEFCTDAVCEDSEMHFRIIDGCLKLGPTGETDVAVNASTSRRLNYSFEIGELDAFSRLSYTPSSRILALDQDIYEGKVRVFSSRFKGRPVTR